jgi:hypothetical protein
MLPDLQPTHLFLLHEFRVRTVVDDILAEDGRCQDGVDFLGANVADLAVQDEVVALGSDIDGRLLAEEDERKAVAVLSRKQALLVRPPNSCHRMGPRPPFPCSP